MSGFSIQSTVVDDDLEEFAEEEARRILDSTLDREDSDDGDSFTAGFQLDQNGSPILTRATSSEVSDEPQASEHEESEVHETAQFGERTVTRVTRTTITHAPVVTTMTESMEAVGGAPVTLETVTVRSTRSSVASSPASPMREFALRQSDHPVGEITHSRSSEDGKNFFSLF